MTFASYFFLLTSVLGWLMYAMARRRLVRELRRQSMEHISALSKKHILSFRQGMACERARWQPKELEQA